jgi:hypothetical protein
MDNTAIESKRAELLARVWSSPDYRRQFAANPKDIIASEFGLDLPAGTNVEVLFDTPDTEHLVLIPPTALSADDEPDVQVRLSTKAWADSPFKAALLADPKAAFRDHLNYMLPDKPALKVVEQTENTYYIVIPQRPPNLSDAELDQVAGGTSTLQKVQYGVGGGSIAAGVAMSVIPGGVLFGAPLVISGVGTLLADGDIRHGIATAAKAVGSGVSTAAHAVASIFHRRW